MIQGVLTIGQDLGIKRIEVKISDLTELVHAKKLQEKLLDKMLELNSVLMDDGDGAIH
jgi:hypothetical protein